MIKCIYYIISGNPSITLRHRLICEIRACKTIPTSTIGNDSCKIEQESNEESKPKMLMKFPTKLLLPTDDLKTKMLVW